MTHGRKDKGLILEVESENAQEILIVDDGGINVLVFLMYEIVTFSILALALCSPLCLALITEPRFRAILMSAQSISPSTDIYIIQPGLSSALIIRSITAALEKKKYDDIIAGRVL